MRRLPALVIALVCSATYASAWGERGHYVINRAAVRAIASDGPAFLQTHEDWIVYLAVIPDTWRRSTEPFLKMLEDPNHGWFQEQFASIPVPRSRYAFVLALHDEHRRLTEAGEHAAAALTNVRWTGTLPYAAVENYERMVAGMRRLRDARQREADTRHIELEIASYLGRLGHYIGDGAQPLHDTIHHDGWKGDNPKHYTTDPRVHGRFESQFVDLMGLRAEDVQAEVPASVVLDDPFDAIIAHLVDASTQVEQVYALDASGALTTADHQQARALVLRQVTRAAALLRDLAHTAWMRSGEPVPALENPTVPSHPEYDPATGSAPAHRRSPQP